MLNKVILTGNIAEKPEIRYTGRAMAVCNAKLKHRRVTNYNGQRKEENFTFIVDSFGDVGEELSRVQPGEAVCVTGRLKMDEWEDEKTRQKRTKLKIIVESFEFLSDGVEADPEPEGDTEEKAEEKPPTRRATAKPKPEEPEEDDVPF
jgi:single-strand DNA-binding protein